MIKLPPLAKAFSELHYSNACTSEFLGCHIFNLLGIPAQETLLGIYRRNNKTYNVVACKDFATEDLEFQDFASCKNQVIDSEKHGYGTELESLLFTMEEQNLVDKRELLSFFGTRSSSMHSQGISTGTTEIGTSGKCSLIALALKLIEKSYGGNSCNKLSMRTEWHF